MGTTDFTVRAGIAELFDIFRFCESSFIMRAAVLSGLSIFEPVRCMPSGLTCSKSQAAAQADIHRLK